MRNCLSQGSELILHELNNSNITEVRIIENLGAGATCVAYLAEDCSNPDLQYVVKECCPIKGSSRENGAEVIWNDAESKEKYLSRFTYAFETQLRLQKNDKTSNDFAHVTHNLHEANNTLYMLVDSRKGAVTYDEFAGEETLQDIFRTAKALSEAVGAQHRVGYLNLDIKPSNIMVVPGRPDSVLLLDFDSLVEKQTANTVPSSYSPGFAAPEQLQHKMKKISEATDVYAIGAIVFWSIFIRRVPTAEDRSIYSDWNLDDNPLFANLSNKTKRLTKELFHKTLAASPKDRFQNTSALSKLLKELIDESDPARRHLISTCPAPVNIFVGREKELCRIHDAFASGNRLVFLTGMGGIGKTELAKNYAKRYGSDYDAICFGEFKDSIESIEDLFMDKSFIHVENDAEGSVSLENVKGLLDEHVLLIIDNYSIDPDAPADKDLERLLSCKCSILITTRSRSEDYYESAPVIDLSELSTEEQYSLFEKEYGESFPEDERINIQDILSQIKGFTLLIPLIAKLLKRSSLSLEKVLNKIRASGVTDISGIPVPFAKRPAPISSILKSVLDMSGLSTEERFVLDCFSILKGYSVKRETIIRWIGEDYEIPLSDLIDRHWLQISGVGKDARISVHDVIGDVLKSDTEHTPDTAWILIPIEEYIDEIDKYTHRKEKDEHGYSEEQIRGTSPDLSYPDSYIDRLYGSALIRFTKKSKLIDVLLNNLDPASDATLILNIYFAITEFDDYYVYNFTTGGIDLLKAIEAEPSFRLTADDETTIDLYYFLTLFSLRDLYNVDRNTKRPASTVKRITGDIISYANTVVKLTLSSDEDANKKYLAIYRLYCEMLMAGLTWGINMFITDYPEYSKDAAESFREFINDLAVMIISSFPEQFDEVIKLEQSWCGDSTLKRFNRIMQPGGYEAAWDFYDKEREWEGQETYRLCEEGFVKSKYDITLEEADRILKKVKKLGYKPTVYPEKEETIELSNLTNPETLLKAETLLAETDQLYKLAEAELQSSGEKPIKRRGIYQFGGWLKISCIYACCKGEYDQALKYYEDYCCDSYHGLLHIREWWEVYKVLEYLGFHSIAAETLKMNMAYLDKKLKSGSWHGFSSDKEASRWALLQELLEHAQILDDSEKVEEYKSLMNQMADDGL